ncbi:hypothetical protein GA0061103_3821 [Rhizobium multihospitium]|uniref:Uncharacterized protein n=1 Tax=Rhizobium multihospitium TaxID=410764 RepID=A0A1C3VIB2_9HYPH|nr:hypothetical protein GA0061103_3821 [Rhizobium multihospitium]
MDSSVAWQPLTLTLSPPAGRGNDLNSTANLACRWEGCGRYYPLLPVKTGRRWPPFDKSSGGRMRGFAATGGIL